MTWFTIYEQQYMMSNVSDDDCHTATYRSTRDYKSKLDAPR